MINADENANSVFESAYEDSSSSFPQVVSSNNLAHTNAGSNSAASLTTNGPNGHATSQNGVVKNRESLF